MPLLPSQFDDTHLEERVPLFAAAISTYSNLTKNGDWSSIIGIVTAIVGNVLISFALNTQRYAHVRIEQEQQAKEDALHNAKPRSSDDSYGTLQGDIAEERAKRNASARFDDSNEDLVDDGNNETDPLIPRIASPGPSDPGYDLDDNDEKVDDEITKKSYLKSPYWWVGITLMVVGEAGNFLAYGFAPASIVSPLGVVAIISNCLIAPFMLKEKFRVRDFFGVIIAIGGVCTIILSGDGSNPKLGPDTIWEFVKRWEFETYLGVTVAVIIVLMLISSKYGHKTILIDIGLVGLFGGYTALATKGVASLLTYRLLVVFTFPVFYLLVAVLAFTAIMQIKYINRALQHFPSTQVIPTQFCMFTIFVIVGSAILYREFETTTGARVGQFVGGCALTFLGVWFLTSGRNGKNDLEDDNIDEEQGIDMVDEEALQQAEAFEAPSFPQTPSKTPSKFLANAQSTPVRLIPSTPPDDTDSPASFATAPTNPSTPMPAQSRPINRLQHKSTSNAQYSTAGSVPQSSPLRPRPAQTPSDTLAPSSVISTPARRQRNSVTDADTPSPSSSGLRAMMSRRLSMIPNPLTSPLSAGLSAVVADTRRRRASIVGTGAAAPSLIGRRGSSFRRQGGRASAPDPEVPTEAHQAESSGGETAQDVEEAPVGRSHTHE